MGWVVVHSMLRLPDMMLDSGFILGLGIIKTLPAHAQCLSSGFIETAQSHSFYIKPFTNLHSCLDPIERGQCLEI